MRSFQTFTVALLISLACCPLYGQLVLATLTGQITDASNSAIPGASVVAVDSATGATFKVTSNEEGTYVLANLPLIHTASPSRWPVSRPVPSRT